MPRILVAILCLLQGLTPCAQSFHGGLAAGGMMYHGDLSHNPVYDMRAATAGSGHIEFNDRLSVFGQYMFGHIGSSDRNSTDRILRNLSFDSHVFEWSLGLRVNLISSERSLVVPYLHASAAFYRVAPWTSDSSGNIVYLYPVHTQGNGLPQFPDLPEDRLIKYCFPVGAGIAFTLTERLSLDLEGSLRYTFDDRMDDVGGYFPDLALLKASGKARTDLTYRTAEIQKSDMSYPQAGTPRGNPKSNDWYSSLQVRIRVKLFSREDPTRRRRTLLGSDMWMY
jgi:hypothetical protein